MPKEFQNTKNSMRKRETTNKQEMDSPTIRIASDLESIEQNRRIEFSIKGKDLTIDYLSISSRVAQIGFVTGEVKSIETPQAICESIINGIILGLKSRKIQNNKEYDYREFKERYLKKLWDKEVTQELKEIIDENMQINQLRRSTTEGVDYQMKEDSEYVTIEPASLKKQEPELFDFASSKATTKEINNVVGEVVRSNASNGIATENIRSVSRFDSNSKEVLEHPIFNSTDVEGPKLPEINGGQYIRISVAGIAGGILGGVLAVAFAGLGYFIWHRKNREGSYDVEKAQRSNGETASLSEQAQLEHSRATPEAEERESLLSNATSIAHLSSQISIE
ncbi:hypothetical protein wVul_0288 [Wolbachia endosymbiont of Armadillidium vulgare str. wVulC]|uniref:hypothetical protein n=1 Tax=Wolbachia endosymbiont of Armadillidium vulgare TaxID=77039 RepID=UPI00064A05EC|nr:hypothetical protein [Wolbachia endosymbiont of Armadillidium vulgare]KLT23085.1 hypothetical protein wVul_0288 [Wolbachia endosymbiont of Armadillidium vulgare str. wVulC]OJH31265.1 hypothetical protein Wxf_00650 [Wolbachia endosymbiont of Armadillidium vulgare]OJH32424.1 hypothetical protein Wxf_01858 [Wolbachia endosymbiont of Armadillidium vulgare]